MSVQPEIRVLKVEYGPVPIAARLNRKLAPDRPLLFARLEILWKEKEPFSAMHRLEEELLRLSPTFAKHECRGPEKYHVFLRGGRRTPAPSIASGGPAGAPALTQNSFDGCLALAHLLEHAVIDFQCVVTDEKRCSGVTGAHRNPPCRFDLMVECPDFCVGRACLALAVEWLTSSAAGQALGPAQRQTLDAARLAYRRPGKMLTAPSVARQLGWPEPQAESALAELRDVGYLNESPYTLNLSGIPVYRLCTN